MADVINIAKNLGINHNVCIRVIDEITGKTVSEHVGHNAATSTLLNGLGHFLMGEALAGGSVILADWIPQYISLGTMGLRNQEEDEDGLPAGVGDGPYSPDQQAELFTDYMEKTPGFGSDGYDKSLANGRDYPGLGYKFEDRPDQTKTVECELVSATFPRSKITYRQCLPESRSESPKTIDVIFSALISTGALKQFREPGRDYIFISEVGLWSYQKNEIEVPTPEDPHPPWTLNGLLAGYRLCPPDSANWDMTDENNRKILKQNILRVGLNQVVQVIWKIQLGAVEQVGGSSGSGDPKWYIFI